MVLSVRSVERGNVGKISATDIPGGNARSLIIKVPVTYILQDSVFKTANKLFLTVTEELASAVASGLLAMNLQKTAITNTVDVSLKHERGGGG